MLVGVELLLVGVELELLDELLELLLLELLWLDVLVGVLELELELLDRLDSSDPPNVLLLELLLLDVLWVLVLLLLVLTDEVLVGVVLLLEELTLVVLRLVELLELLELWLLLVVGLDVLVGVLDVLVGVELLDRLVVLWLVVLSLCVLRLVVVLGLLLLTLVVLVLLELLLLGLLVLVGVLLDVLLLLSLLLSSSAAKIRIVVRGKRTPPDTASNSSHVLKCNSVGLNATPPSVTSESLIWMSRLSSRVSTTLSAVANNVRFVIKSGGFTVTFRTRMFRWESDTAGPRSIVNTRAMMWFSRKTKKSPDADHRLVSVRAPSVFTLFSPNCS